MQHLAIDEGVEEPAGAVEEGHVQSVAALSVEP